MKTSRIQVSAYVASLLIAFVWLALASSRDVVAQAGVLPPGVPPEVGVDQHLQAQVLEDLEFREESGRTVKLRDLQRSKPIVLVLIQYRCPSLCSVVLNDMLSTFKVIPQEIGTQYDVWVVSIDPEETPELAAKKKGEYVRTYLRTRPQAQAVDSGWRFLTGNSENIRQLARSIGYRYKWDAITGQFIHPAALVLLTPEAKVSRYFFGVDYDPTDLRLSLVEASNGKIGTVTDKILLYCYHYDPATGKYSLAVANTLRAGGVITVLLLAGGFWLLVRADRRRTRRQLAALPNAPAGGAP